MRDSKFPFYLTAHSTGGPHNIPPQGYYTGHTTMAQDGITTMDKRAVVNYLARGLLLWAHDVMEQLPPALRVEIRKTDFLGAFKYGDEDGELVDLEPWPMGPVDDVQVRYTEGHVQAQIDMLDVLYNRMARGIAEVAPNPFKPEYLTDRGKKTRPTSENSFISSNASLLTD